MKRSNHPAFPASCGFAEKRSPIGDRCCSELKCSRGRRQPEMRTARFGCSARSFPPSTDLAGSTRRVAPLMRRHLSPAQLKAVLQMVRRHLRPPELRTVLPMVPSRVWLC